MSESGPGRPVEQARAVSEGVRRGVLVLGVLLLLPGACSLCVWAIFVRLAQDYGTSETLSIFVTTSPFWLGGFALAGAEEALEDDAVGEDEQGQGFDVVGDDEGAAFD